MPRRKRGRGRSISGKERMRLQRANESHEVRMERLSQMRRYVAEKRAKERPEDRRKRLSQVRKHVANRRLKEKLKEQELRLSLEAKYSASQNYAACIIPMNEGNDNAVLLGDKNVGHYVCSLCDISFEDLSILCLHMGVHIDCVDPKSSYSSRSPNSSISSGGKDTDDIRDYWCDICCKLFNNFHFFTYHMQAHHEGKPFQCKICARTFTSKSSLYNHICNHVSKKSCRCSSGHYASQTKDDQPIIFESAEDLHLCSICHMGFDTKKQLGIHMQKHSTYLRCSFTCSSNESHDEQVKGRALVLCEICFEIFPNKKKRDNHMKTHSQPEKMVMNAPITSTLNTVEFMNNYAQEIISKTLKERLERTNEELVSVSAIMVDPKPVGSSVSKDFISSGKRNFLDDTLKMVEISNGIVMEGWKEKKGNSACKNEVNTSGVLDMSIKTVMSDKGYSETETDAGNDGIEYICEKSRKYECKLCFSVWTNKKKFWQHLLGHSEKVPYTCKVCAEIFTEKSWMTHKVLNCKCAACGRLIKRKESASIHPKLCRVGNPFTCTLCSERFPTREGFRDHMKFHYREKTSACKVCGEVVCNHETDLQEEMHRRENEDPSPTMFPTEDEEDILPDTPRAEILSQVCDGERNAEISSVKIETGFDFITVEPFSVVKEEPVYEERQFLNDSAATTDVEPSNLIVMTDEIDSHIPEEREIDPLA